MKRNLISLLALLAFGACKKSGTSNTNPPSPGGIVQTGSPNYPKTITTILYDTVSGNKTDSLVTSIGYDAQNRYTSNLTHEYSLPAAQVIEVDTALISYTTDTINVRERNWQNGSFLFSQLTAYRLDQVTHLAVNSLITRTDISPPSVSSDSQTFQYDANGYLLVARRFEPTNSSGHLELSSAQSYTISNGNIALQTFYVDISLGGDTSSAVFKIYQVFTYSALPNAVMNMTGNGNNWDGFATDLLGHASANQLINSYDSTNINPDISLITNYSNTLDSHGRTSAVMITTGSGRLMQLTRTIYY